MRVAFALVWCLATGPLVAGLLRSPTVPAWVVMLVYHAGCLTATRVASGGLGRRPGTAILGLWALGTTIVVGLAFGVVRSWVSVLDQPVPAWIERGVRPPVDLWFLVYYTVINPWIEERYWRGTLLGPSVRSKLGTNSARILAALGFLPLHWFALQVTFGSTWAWVLSLPILFASIFWTALREHRGTWEVAASHLGADLALCISYLLFLRPA